MSFMRTRAARTIQQGLRAGAARPMVQGRSQFAARRYASSGGHGEQGSDLPWLISALAITPVGTYFLWPSSSGDSHHGHDEQHEEQHEESEPQEEETAQQEQPQEEQPKEEQPKEEQPKEEPSQEDEAHEKAKESEETARPSGTEGDSQPKAPDANKISSGTEEGEVRGPQSGPPSTERVQGKGHMKNDSDGMNQTSKREPDGKGAYKNRKDSALGKELHETGVPDTSKHGTIVNKQAGTSNTPTRHSIPIHESNEKSKKPEGGPDTAKLMGTVDPSRPAK